MYRYEFTPEARKQLKKLSPEIQKLIVRKLDFFISSDKPLSFATSLIHFGIGQYRFRVGDYRIIFDTHEEVLTVHGVGHRRDIYR